MIIKLENGKITKYIFGRTDIKQEEVEVPFCHSSAQIKNYLFSIERNYNLSFEINNIDDTINLYRIV